MPSNDVDLVMHGYTISVGTAAFGRIGDQYVMRDRTGQRITLPVTTQLGLLLEVWMAFRRAAGGNEPTPAILACEIAPSHPRVANSASAARGRDTATRFAA